MKWFFVFMVGTATGMLLAAPTDKPRLLGPKPLKSNGSASLDGSYAMDLAVLKALQEDRLAAVAMPLLNRSLVFSRNSVVCREKTTSWIGVNRDSGETILMTIADEHFFATFFQENRQYLVEVDPSGHAVVAHVDPGSERPLTNCVVNPDRPSAMPLTQPAATLCDSDIDVMVLYTKGVKMRHGDQTLTRIQFLVDAGNLAFANSAITTRVNLVHHLEVDYPDDSPYDPLYEFKMYSALADLTYGRGVFEQVELLRDQYGADQVTLLRALEDEGCGLAFTSEGDGNPYSIVHDGRTVTSGSCSLFKKELVRVQLKIRKGADSSANQKGDLGIATTPIRPMTIR